MVTPQVKVKINREKGHTQIRSSQVNMRRFLMLGGSGKEEGKEISLRS